MTTSTSGFTYDTLDRLSGVSYQNPASNVTYGYDGTGNRISQTVDGTPTTYSYDAADGLAAINGAATASDQNGNLKPIDANDTFLYDQENRLFRTGPCRGDVNDDGAVNILDLSALSAGGRYQSVEGSTGYDINFDLDGDGLINILDLSTASGDYNKQCKSTGPDTGNERDTYNGDGLRVRARTYPAGVQADHDYVWDVGAGLPVVLQDTDVQSGGVTTYVYGLGQISTTDSVSGNTSYYLADGLGSTSQLTDSAGTVTDRYAYDAYGAVRAQTGATANDFRFTGQQQDANAQRGLYYLRARAYDPALGRFLQRAPLPFVQRYAYAGDNPANLTDPSGLCGICDLVSDKGADVKDWGSAVVDHPGSAIQVTIGTAVALTSTGDRTRRGGVTFYEHCRGSCSLPFSGGAFAITLGHDIFISGQTNPRLLRHELTHVRQGDRYGIFWIPAYLLEQLRVSPNCRFDFACYERSNRFEKEALRAEGGKE